MHERFGQLSLLMCSLLPLSMQKTGSPFSPTVADLWGRAVKLYSGMRSDAQFEPWFTHFAPQNRAPEPGESFRSPDIAATLKRIAETKGEAFYRGEIARRSPHFFAAHGGLLTADDLAVWRAGVGGAF